MTILTYRGQSFEQQENGLVNLTQMCQANGKRFSDWYRLESSKAYIIALESETQICTSHLLIVNKGNSSQFEQGTWGHPLIAIAIAQWISPAFHVWCNQHIKQLIETGQTSIDPPKLPSRVVAVETARVVDEIMGTLGDIQPRLTQFLIDHAVSDIMPAQKQLTGDRLRGVVEIAEELGYKCNHSNRSMLGKKVKQVCGDLAVFEERLVNGTSRKVCCYPENNPRVIEAIKTFFCDVV